MTTNLDELTIPMWCEHWARWAVRNATGVKGYPNVSIIADRFQFQTQGPGHVTPLGERLLSARGRQTRSYKAPEISDDALAEVLDAGIAQMGQYRPDLQIIIGAEYLGVFPEFLTEAWKPSDAAIKYFDRLSAAWRKGAGFRINALRQREGDTADQHRKRLSEQKLMISKAQFYILLGQAHTYLMCWRDTELKRMIAEAMRVPESIPA